jgi:DNA-binding transcriptional MocR family regulator
MAGTAPVSRWVQYRAAGFADSLSIVAPITKKAEGPEVLRRRPAHKRELVKQHLQELLASGALRRGSRVPSILELSAALALGKNTVIAALDDLCGEGILEARDRSGFFVRSAPRVQRAQATRLSDLALDRVAHGMATILVESGDDFVPIGAGTAAESLLATPEWTATLRSAVPRDPHLSLRYADPKGEPRLREVLSSSGRSGGAPVPPDRVVITHGAVEALNLGFATIAAATGSRRVAVESPGYFMLAPMLIQLGLEPVALPRSQEGIDLDALRAEQRRGPLAAVMVNPNHQNPTGATLSLAQRFELARLADERKLFIVEDDVYRGLWTEVEEPPSIHSLLPERTLYIGSFSKTLGPAMRIGFALAPECLAAQLRRRKFLQTLSGDAYTQCLVAEFVDRRGYQRHLTELREELARRARIARAQSAGFESLGRFAAPYTGGLFWRFEFCPEVDVMRLYRAAREKNLLLSPGSFFHVDEAAARDSWMRVNVSRCEGRTLAKALGMLRELAHG